MRTEYRLLIATASMLLFVNTASADTGQGIYDSTCVVCHGQDGKPDPDSPVVKGLGVLPADFSDPLFNSREPAGDWEMVIKYGGHAMGLARQMPPQQGVLSDEQISDVTRFIKGMVDTSEYPPGEMNLMLPIRTKKAFPEDEVVYKGLYTNEPGSDGVKNVVEFEKRIGKRGQAIVEVVQYSLGGDIEFSEIELGYKQALSYSKRHILSGAAVIAVPIEADGDGEFQTYFAYGRLLSPSWTFQSSLRFKLPFEKVNDGEVELAGIVHYVHSPWPRRVFPAFEVVATKPYLSRNGDFEWSVLPQVRIGLTRGGHVALNLGVEVPMSSQDWDERFHVTLLWDFADGSFFQGW